MAGKHSHEFGVIPEECYPYEGHDTSSCSPLKTCQPTFVANYQYVGGYYGGCNEYRMMKSLLRNGPLAVAIEVTTRLVMTSSLPYMVSGL